MLKEQKRQKAADKANKVVEQALNELCKTFRKSATLFLEEKHLHNEFDRILRRLVKKKEQVAETVDKPPVKFPLIMNEYATVHHYSRKELPASGGCSGGGRFEKTLDDKPGLRSGSLDYVWLWDEWVKDNSYCTAVNKDVDFRRGEKGEGKKHDTRRYLVIVEFKFLHYAEYSVTTDENIDPPRPTSIDAALAIMEEEMQLDLNKVCNEQPPFGHIVYFNSKIPLLKKNDGASNSEKKPPTPTSVEGVFKALKPPQSLDGRQIRLWYMQGGVKTRSPWSQNEEKFPHTDIVRK